MISNMDDLGNEANVVFVQEGATVGEVEALLKRKDILFGQKLIRSACCFVCR